MKKIFITGASGKLGSYLYPILKKEFKILGTSNKKKISNFKKIDLLDNSNLRKQLNKFNPDIIIHLAALTNVDLCEKDFDLAYKTNILATNNVVNWCLETNSSVKFIYISSDQVYNSKTLNSEESKIDPLNLYALSKIISEELVCQLTNAIILRTNFFGKSMIKKQSFSDWAIKSFRRKKSFFLVDDVFFSPLRMKTISEIISKILKKKYLKNYGIYNLGSKDGISKKSLALKFASILSVKNKLFETKKINEICDIKRSKNMKMNVLKFEKTFSIALPKVQKEIKNEIINYEKN